MSKSIKKYHPRDFWDRMIKKDISKLFSTLLSDLEKQNLFKQFVEVIHIETSTKCNRHCGYCPLAYDSRGGTQINMNETIMDRLIDDLKKINYDGLINLNLYNEPLLDLSLEKNIYKIKSILPNSFISLHSNGDFLTKDRLLKVRNSGLDELRVTLHSSLYEDTDRKNALDKFFKQLNLEYKVSKLISNETIVAEKEFGTLNLVVMCVNWSELGSDRVGVVESLVHMQKERMNPCMRPFREVVVAADGSCYPCCNFFPNSEVSKKYSMGNISEKNIYDIFTAEIMVKFRKNLFDFSPKYGPCQTCNNIDNSTVDSDSLRKEILNSFD